MPAKYATPEIIAVMTASAANSVFNQSNPEGLKAMAATAAVGQAFTLTDREKYEVAVLIGEAAGVRGYKPNKTVRVFWVTAMRDALVNKGVVTVTSEPDSDRPGKHIEEATLTDAALKVARQFISIE